jgi:hypothetical protein
MLAFYLSEEKLVVQTGSITKRTCLCWYWTALCCKKKPMDVLINKNHLYYLMKGIY